MNNQHPIWDQTGQRILIDENGSEIWLDEFQIRRLISRQQLGVMRQGNLARGRKIVLKAEEGEVFPKTCRKVQTAQPFSVLVPVSDKHKAYMHVAERCESMYDGRSLALGIDMEGNPVYADYRISGHCL